MEHKKTNLVPLYITLGILVLIIGGILGNLVYNYELEKCQNLKSSQTNYNFDYRVELNANYNSNCYDLNNHPLALASFVFLGGMITLTLSAGVFILIYIVRMIVDVDI